MTAVAKVYTWLSFGCLGHIIIIAVAGRHWKLLDMNGAAPMRAWAHSFDLAGIHRRHAVVIVHSGGFSHNIKSISVRGWASRRENFGNESWSTWWLHDRSLARRRLYQVIITGLSRLYFNLVHLVSFFNLLFGSESESFFGPHVRWLCLVVNFPDHGVLVNWHSAEWAELQGWVVGVVIYKVLVALLLELMSLVAGKLNDMLTLVHHREANTALADRFGAKSRIDCATKMLLSPLNEGLASTISIRGSLTKRLRSDEGKPAVVLKFIPANRMILKVVQTAELVWHEVEAENAVLELLVVVDVGALVTAAGQERVE